MLIWKWYSLSLSKQFLSAYLLNILFRLNKFVHWTPLQKFYWKHWFAGLSCFFVEYQYFIGEMWSTYWKKDKQKLKYLIEMYGKSCFSVGIISRYTVLEVQFDICEEIDKKLLVHCFFLNISKFRKVWQMAHMGISKSYLPSEVTL